MDNPKKRKRTETFSHRLTKFWLAEYCWEHGLSFATEVVFRDNQRADFVIKDWKIAIEVLGSESSQQFLKKKYPIPSIPLGVTDNPKNIIEMLDDMSALNGGGWEFYLKKNLQELQKAKPNPISSVRDIEPRLGIDYSHSPNDMTFP